MSQEEKVNEKKMEQRIKEGIGQRKRKQKSKHMSNNNYRCKKKMNSKYNRSKITSA